MALNKDHITIELVLQSMKDDAKCLEMVELLKSSTFEKDELKGIQSFLEDNNYSREKLTDFLNKGSRFEVDQFPLPKENAKDYSLVFKIAAVVVPVLIMASYLLFFNTSKYERIAFEYTPEEKGLPVLMSKNSKKEFDEAMNDFRANEYENALNGFQQLLTNQPKNDTLLYFSGYAALKIKEYKFSKNTFEKVKVSSNFYEKSQFLLALNLIALNNIPNAEKKLEEIASNSFNKYSDKAKAVLKKL